MVVLALTEYMQYRVNKKTKPPEGVKWLDSYAIIPVIYST